MIFGINTKGCQDITVATKGDYVNMKLILSMFHNSDIVLVSY